MQVSGSPWNLETVVAVEARERLFSELLGQRVAEMGDQTTGEMELAQVAPTASTV